MINRLKITTLLFGLILGKGFLMAQHMMYYTSERFEYSMMIPEDWEKDGSGEKFKYFSGIDIT